MPWNKLYCVKNYNHPFQNSGYETTFFRAFSWNWGQDWFLFCSSSKLAYLGPNIHRNQRLDDRHSFDLLWMVLLWAELAQWNDAQLCTFYNNIRSKLLTLTIGDPNIRLFIVQNVKALTYNFTNINFDFSLVSVLR